MRKRLSEKAIDVNSAQKILEYFIDEWQNGVSNKREDYIKTLVRKPQCREEKTVKIEFKHIAVKKLKEDWHKLKNANPENPSSHFSDTCSPRVPEMRTLFTAIMPLRSVNKGPNGIEYQIHYKKLAEKYPNWDNANKYKTVNSVNQESNKKSKSRGEQREIFEQLLASGEVDTQAEIARKFDVSRAWVSKVLS